MLEDLWTQYAGRYTNDGDLVSRLWDEIAEAYSRRNRHYHTLSHLQHAMEELIPYERQIADWDVVVFAVFYHDIIYNVLSKDNEEKSAVVAGKALSDLNFPNKRTEKCKTLIILTKNHVSAGDSDGDYLLDADLSILGSAWPSYNKYVEQIRKEFGLFPDLVFRPGRIKVINHFLSMKSIFKTKEFNARYEKPARENLQRELELWRV